MKKIIQLPAIILILCACTTSSNPTESPTKSQTTFEITSPAFANGGTIPVDHTCKGKDKSPALAWTEPPAGTQSFALIVDDPDAPGTPWVHWVIFNIPATARGLNEGLPGDAQLSNGSLQARTSGGATGYHGPCPPSGTHHYFFKLYALDTTLSLANDANKDTLLAAMLGHMLANAELMGTFAINP